MRVGALRHRVTIETPGTPVPDGEGGSTQTWTVVASRVPAHVGPASARDLERVAAGTVLSMASHLVIVRYVSGVTTQARVIFHDVTDRTFSVVGVYDPEERHQQLDLSCVEMVA